MAFIIIKKHKALDRRRQRAKTLHDYRAAREPVSKNRFKQH